MDRPAAANQALSVLGAFLQWCIRRTLIQHNPIAGYGLPVKLKARERVLNDDELLTVARLTFQSPEQYHRLVALLVLTGQRRNEIGRAEWAWLNEQTLVVPAHVAKNGRQHTVPLADTALNIIATIPRTSRYLFPLPSDPNKTHQSWSYMKRRVRRSLRFLRLDPPRFAQDLQHQHGQVATRTAAYRRAHLEPHQPGLTRRPCRADLQPPRLFS